MVDEHTVSGIQALSVYFLFCAGLTAYSISYYRLWHSGSVSRRYTRSLFYIQVALFSLMLPFLSNDVFSLLTYGDLANKGVDVFSPKHHGSFSAFVSYCSPLAVNGTNVYGPLCLFFLQIATLFSAENIYVALVAYKLIALLWAVIFIEVAYLTATKVTGSSRNFVFIALNPVFLLQGIGQLHTDLMAVAMAACLFYSILKNKTYWAFVFAALSIAVKMNYVLLLPFIAVAAYIIYKKDYARFWINLLSGIFITILLLCVLYFPFYTSINTVLVPFKTVYGQIPTKSIPEVFGDGIYYIVKVFRGGFNLGGIVESDGVLISEKIKIWNSLVVVCRALALATSAFLLFRFFKGPRNKGAWTNTYLRLLLLFLLFYSHVIYPWYLVMVMPFFWFETDAAFMAWFLVLSCFANAQTIWAAVDRNSSVYLLVLPLIFINVIMFLWRFKSNFLSIKTIPG